jgi:hypothetical protein
MLFDNSTVCPAGQCVNGRGGGKSIREAGWCYIGIGSAQKRPDIVPGRSDCLRFLG